MPDTIDEALGFRGPHFLYVYSVDLFSLLVNQVYCICRVFHKEYIVICLLVYRLIIVEKMYATI